MPNSYKHLTIEREPQYNNRRTRRGGILPVKRDDLRSHGQQLFNKLNETIQKAKQQITVIPGSYVLKLNYTLNLMFLLKIDKKEH